MTHKVHIQFKSTIVYWRVVSGIPDVRVQHDVIYIVTAWLHQQHSMSVQHSSTAWLHLHRDLKTTSTTLHVCPTLGYIMATSTTLHVCPTTRLQQHPLPHQLLAWHHYSQKCSDVAPGHLLMTPPFRRMAWDRKECGRARGKFPGYDSLVYFFTSSPTTSTYNLKVRNNSDEVLSLSNNHPTQHDRPSFGCWSYL